MGAESVAAVKRKLSVLLSFRCCCTLCASLKQKLSFDVICVHLLALKGGAPQENKPICMGAILPKPILTKVVERNGSEHFSSAACEINGQRMTMEDAHCMRIGADRLIFGVFDGHSNEKCSEFISKAIPDKLMKIPTPIPDAALEKMCLDVDEEFLDKVGDGGSTATFAIVEKPNNEGTFATTICNVGDSRTLIVRQGKLLFATTDHKPMDPSERQRIERAGGSVRLNRVDGDLAVSRAFGDGAFKRNRDDARNQKVIAVPDVTRHNLIANDILIICCDGVFEGNLTNEQVAQFVYQQQPFPAGDLGVAAARVCDQAVRSGSKDNISCMIVQLCEGIEALKLHSETTCCPGPPYTRTHDPSRQQYAKMAERGHMTLASALQRRFELLQLHITGQLNSSNVPPVCQTAFEMSEPADVDVEVTFFGSGPPPNATESVTKAWFQSLAEGNAPQ